MRPPRKPRPTAATWFGTCRFAIEPPGPRPLAFFSAASSRPRPWRFLGCLFLGCLLGRDSSALLARLPPPRPRPLAFLLGCLCSAATVGFLLGCSSSAATRWRSFSAACSSAALTASASAFASAAFTASASALASAAFASAALTASASALASAPSASAALHCIGFRLGLGRLHCIGFRLGQRDRYRWIGLLIASGSVLRDLEEQSVLRPA